MFQYLHRQDDTEDQRAPQIPWTNEEGGSTFTLFVPWFLWFENNKKTFYNNHTYSLLVNFCFVLAQVHGGIFYQPISNLASACKEVSRMLGGLKWNDDRCSVLHEKNTSVSVTGSSRVLGPSSASGAPGTVISPSISMFTLLGTKFVSVAAIVFFDV